MVREVPKGSFPLLPFDRRLCVIHLSTVGSNVQSEANRGSYHGPTDLVYGSALDEYDRKLNNL